MADAKRQHDWDIGSSIVATLVNVNKDPKSQACNPNDLNPYRSQPEPLLINKLRSLANVQR